MSADLSIDLFKKFQAIFSLFKKEPLCERCFAACLIRPLPGPDRSARFFCFSPFWFAYKKAYRNCDRLFCTRKRYRLCGAAATGKETG
jgi:hypothetical protein